MPKKKKLFSLLPRVCKQQPKSSAARPRDGCRGEERGPVGSARPDCASGPRSRAGREQGGRKVCATGDPRAILRARCVSAPVSLLTRRYSKGSPPSGDRGSALLKLVRAFIYSPYDTPYSQPEQTNRTEVNCAREEKSKKKKKEKKKYHTRYEE